MARSVKFPIV